MPEFEPRLFASDAEIEKIGEGLLAASHAGGMAGQAMARTLPREEWTHEAHLAATTYLLLKRPDVDVDKQLPDIIRKYNESVGGVNSDAEGYHETITRVFLRGVRLFLAEADAKESFHELVNELLLSPMGRRDWPLRFYSPRRLFSVDARRKWIKPDIASVP
jgi:hypothetical protein